MFVQGKLEYLCPTHTLFFPIEVVNEFSRCMVDVAFFFGPQNDLML